MSQRTLHSPKKVKPLATHCAAIAAPLLVCAAWASQSRSALAQGLGAQTESALASSHEFGFETEVPEYLKSKSTYEKLLDIANKAESENPFLIQAMHSKHNDDVVQALYVAGRIGAPALAQPVASTLQNHNPHVRAAAAFALGQIGGEGALNTLLGALVAEKSDAVKGALFVSLGKVASKSQLPLFLNALALRKHSALVAGAAEGLALLWTRDREGWTVPETAWTTLLELLKERPEIANKAAVALVRYRGEKQPSFVASLVKTLPEIVSPSARASAIRALGTLKFPDATAALLEESKRPAPVEVRVELVNALVKQAPSPEVQAALAVFLKDASTQVVVAALQGLVNFKDQAPQLAEQVLPLVNSHPSLWVQKNALTTLATLNPELARQEVVPLLANPASPLYTTAIAVLGQIANASESQQILELLKASEPETVVAALDAISTLDPALASPLPLQAAVESVLSLQNSHALCSAADIATKWQLKNTLPLFMEATQKYSKDDESDARICILNLVGELGTSADAPFLEQAISDNIVQVSRAAADAFEKITKTKSATPVTSQSKLSHSTPSLKDVKKALKSTLVFSTSRGQFRMKMLSAAPLTAANIVQLAKQGFYNNLSFHRVVPHFVAQGGDPRGDGWGGPGYLIRNEASLVPHEVGTVGIATSGKDTGGSQFFVNTATNLHLDGEYTVFAKITKGYDVAAKLEEGDRIFKVEVKN